MLIRYLNVLASYQEERKLVPNFSFLRHVNFTIREGYEGIAVKGVVTVFYAESFNPKVHISVHAVSVGTHFAIADYVSNCKADSLQ